MNMTKFGFGKQITVLIAAICVILFIATVAISVFNIKNALTKTYENKILEITELSVNIMDGYKKKVDSGELTEAQAKKLALDDFRALKYDGKNYVWIMTYDYKYLCHPTRPVGFDGSTLKDKKGKYYIKELADNAINNKDEFIQDYSAKPGDTTKKLYPKIFIAKAFPDWKWIVATGVYTDTINQNVFQTFLDIAITSILVMLIILFLSNQIFIKNLVKKFNTISDKLNETSHEVEKASSTLEFASQKLAEGSSEQASAIQETSATVEETTSMVQQNSENTKHATVLSKNTKNYANESMLATQKMMGTMESLENSSKEISKIIKSIDDIAFQTNILSLNAAVEAARAGEAGKGFAVVAEEVRNLAQKSAQSAKDTEAIIAENINLSKEGVVIAKEVETSFSKINDEIQKVDGILEEISTATTEQAQGITQINKAISQMELSIQASADSASSTATASQELSQQVDSMNDIVTHLSSIINGQQN